MNFKFLNKIAFALTLLALLIFPVVAFAGTLGVASSENQPASMFSVENIVTTIIGFIVATFGTNWLKQMTGLQGAGATLLAFLVSVATAIIAVAASIFLSGEAFSWELLSAKAFLIFGFATLAYNTLMKNRTPSRTSARRL